jgi:hypothetical protein
MLACFPPFKQQSQSKFHPDMKNLFALLMIVVLATFCSCQKHLTDEELQARIEQEVKRQLAAERETQEKELVQRRAQFNSRRNALHEKKGATTNTLAPGVPRAPIRPPIREGSTNPAMALPPGTIRTPRLPPGVTLPERSGAGLPEFSRMATPPEGSAPATSKTSAIPPVTPGSSESASVSPLPEAAEGVSPTPTPAAPDGTPQ